MVFSDRLEGYMEYCAEFGCGGLRHLVLLSLLHSTI